MITVSAALETLLDKNHIAPELRVSLYDTTKTVPSNGFDVKYYTFDASQDLSGDWTAASGVTEVLDGNEFSTVLSFDWGEGAPPPVTQVDNYSARWTGYFYARYSGVYTFYLDSGQLCGTQIKFNSSYLTFSDGTTSGSPWSSGDLQSKTAELSASTASLTAGEWYPIEVDFYTGSNKNGASLAYFTAKYKEPAGATTSLDKFGDALGVSDYPADDNKKPLSAGVVNNASGWLSGVELTGIVSYDLDRPFGEVAQAAFDVNLSWVSVLDRTNTVTGTTSTVYVDSTEGAPSAGVLEINDVTHIYTSKTSVTFTLETAANILSTTGTVAKLKDTPYAYDKDDGSFGIIKQFKLVRFEIGMNNGSGTINYVDRLWGNVFPDPVVSRDPDENSLTVLVQDFSAAMNVDYNRNYPDQSSYSMAGLYDGATYGKGADGLTRPIAYDGWLLDATLRDLAIKANIDPVWMYDRKKISNEAIFEKAYSDYYIRGEDVYLEKKPLYGSPQNVSAETADSEYIWAFGYGETLLSIAYDLCKNFGYGLSFNEMGDMSFNGMDIPQEKLYAVDYATSGTIAIVSDTNWTKTVNLSSPKGIDMAVSTSGETITFTENCCYIDLILTRDEASGATITLQVDSVDVSEVDMDGSAITLVGGLLDVSYAGDWSYYDGIDADGATNHSVIRITTSSYKSHALSVELTSGTMKVAAAFFYDVLSTKSVLDMDTRSIDKLEDNISFVDMRNNVIVIGSLLGKYADTSGNVINPNNPIYRHVVSSAIDLSSLYDTTVKNYIGRLIPFEIYNPKIFSEDRADYLATTVLDKYRRAQHAPEFDVMPNPRLQLLDSITLIDIYTGLTSASDNLWVVGYREGLKLDSSGILYEMDTRLTGHKPLLSYQSKDEPDVDNFGGLPIVNIFIKNSGKKICGNGLTAGLTWAADYSPDWVVNMWKGHELVMSTSTSRRVKNSGWLIISNTVDTLTFHADSVALPVGTNYGAISFDPFDADRGSPIEVHYDQVITGKVDVDIKYVTGKLVEKINESKSTEVEEWGASKVLYWGGSDKTNGDGQLMTSEDELFVTFRVNNGDVTALAVNTKKDIGVFVDKMLFSSKILNHGLYVEIIPFNVDNDNDLQWIGTFDTVTDSGSALTLHDPNLPAAASGWVGDIVYINERRPGTLDVSSIFNNFRNEITSVDVASKTITSERGEGWDLLPSTFWSLDTGDKPYKIYTVDGTANDYDQLNFSADDNSNRGIGLRINPIDFYCKIDRARNPIIERTGEWDSDSYNVSILRAKSFLPDVDVSYKGSDYSPAWKNEWRPIIYTGEVESGYEHLETCPTFYWSAHTNESAYSAIHTYIDGGIKTSDEDILDSKETGHGMKLQFGDVSDGLFMLYTVWPKNYKSDSPVPQSDFVMSYAHHNYQAPDKASPSPYGRVVVNAAIDRFSGKRLEDVGEISSTPIYDSGGIINIDQKEIFINPLNLIFGDEDIYDFSFAPREYGDETIAWRIRIYIDIYDRAGRKTGNTRPGIRRRNGNDFNYYTDASNYIEAWWTPDTQSDYTKAYMIARDYFNNTSKRSSIIPLANWNEN